MVAIGGDAGLIAAARAGNERAFVELTSPHRHPLHVHCYRLLGSVHDADDALQETLLRAWRGIGGYEPRAPIGAWLYRIATSGDAEARVMKSFQDAWRAVDINGILQLLATDALLTMPPEGMRFEGAREIAEFFATVPLEGRLDRIRLITRRANGQPTLAAYAENEDGDGYQAYGVMVFAIEAEQIVGITGFPRQVELFLRFGLPASIMG